MKAQALSDSEQVEVHQTLLTCHSFAEAEVPPATTVPVPGGPEQEAETRTFQRFPPVAEVEVPHATTVQMDWESPGSQTREELQPLRAPVPVVEWNQVVERHFVRTQAEPCFPHYRTVDSRDRWIVAEDYWLEAHHWSLPECR